MVVSHCVSPMMKWQHIQASCLTSTGVTFSPPPKTVKQLRKFKLKYSSYCCVSMYIIDKTNLDYFHLSRRSRICMCVWFLKEAQWSGSHADSNYYVKKLFSGKKIKHLLQQEAMHQIGINRRRTALVGISGESHTSILLHLHKSIVLIILPALCN